MGVDAPRRACAADGDCQVIGACACDDCIPSKRMDVQMCERPCKTDPCVGIQPRCVRGLCSANGAAPRPMPPAQLVDDVSAAGQLLLDDRRVAAYFHERERPERVPLVVAWEPGMPHARWTKFGRPVEIVDGLPPAQPYLLPTLVSVDGSKASFAFWYEPEGTRMAGELVKRDGTWTVVSVDIAERRR